MIARLKRMRGGLAFRMVVLLAVALLPIGLVSVLQTFALAREADRKAEANLLALTYNAASTQAGYVQTAIGAANAIASVISVLGKDPTQCSQRFQAFLETTEVFSFAGYIPADGLISCSSSPKPVDISETDGFRDMRKNPRQRVSVNMDAPVSNTSVIVISAPVFKDGAFDGYVAISLPHRELKNTHVHADEQRPLELITFNADGQVISADSGLEDISNRLPRTVYLKGFSRNRELSFTGVTNDGQKRVFAVVPIVPDAVYALGSWEYQSQVFGMNVLNFLTPMLFPVMMWLACLFVAFFALERMVIRPTRNLRARMLSFKRSRRNVPMENEETLAQEIREMSQTWSLLAESVLHDEALLEDAVHEKTILLKEVHHRVKNNLQLIVSILNMKLRKATSDEARNVLSDIRRRVMSIATVHQHLYETSTHGHIRLDELIGSISERMVSSMLPSELNVEVRQSFEETTLVPDQAVPLCLAVSELLTNAFKYLGPDPSGRTWLHIRLGRTAHGEVLFETRNSYHPSSEQQKTDKSWGLGDKLIAAFVNQLQGRIEFDISESEYVARIQFSIHDFQEDTD
ncbi:sensor histidine kinase [Actibacterium sp. D379-3]